MRFVKIRDRFINLEQVTHIEPTSYVTNGLDVHFSAGFGHEFSGQPEQFRITLGEDDAKALINYLNMIATTT